MAKNKKQNITNENKGLNVTWFISASIIVCLTFFAIRYWIKGDPYVPYVPKHLRGKVQVKVYDSQNQRNAKGYNLSY